MTDQEDIYPTFAKIPRLAKNILVTEKIDGTNGLIEVTPEGLIRAGSRNRWLTCSDYDSHFFPAGPANLISTDNYGFGRWVIDNAEELVKLGPGKHYGEWFGLGIQRGYGLQEKRFLLFNPKNLNEVTCCGAVPVLYQGTYDGQAIEEALHDLRRDGSKAAPGFMNPEGIVVRFSITGQLYKAFCEDDGLPKGMLDNPY